MWRKMIIIFLTLILCLATAGILSAEEDCASDCDEVYEPPAVETLLADHDLLHDRWYKRVLGRTDVYRSPDGEIVRVIEDGFNFVTVLSEENGWSRINIDEYVRTENLQDIYNVVSTFTGVLMPEEGLPYTMAWALVNMYPAREAGGNPTESLDFIPRYTRLYIYETVELDDGRWYRVDQESWVHQYQVAKILPVANIPEDVDTPIWVSIDLYEQVLIAYEGDTPVFTTLISTGLPRWPTYEGLFHIYFRNPREYMTWGTVGDDFYSLEEVPWTMFFDEGRAIHGAYWHDGFGYRRSHGCVNLAITDARWMYQWVADYMGNNRSADRETGPAVYVYSSGQYD